MTSGAPHLEGSLRRSWEFGRGGAPLIKNEDRGMNLEAFTGLHSLGTVHPAAPTPLASLDAWKGLGAGEWAPAFSWWPVHRSSPCPLPQPRKAEAVQTAQRMERGSAVITTGAQTLFWSPGDPGPQ